MGDPGEIGMLVFVLDMGLEVVAASCWLARFNGGERSY